MWREWSIGLLFASLLLASLLLCCIDIRLSRGTVHVFHNTPSGDVVKPSTFPFMSIKIEAHRYVLAYQTIEAGDAAYLTIAHLKNRSTWVLPWHLHQVFGNLPRVAVALAHTFALANLLNQNSC